MGNRSASKKALGKPEKTKKNNRKLAQVTKKKKIKLSEKKIRENLKGKNYIVQVDSPKDNADSDVDGTSVKIEDTTQRNLQEEKNVIDIVEADFPEKNVDSESDDMPEKIKDKMQQNLPIQNTEKSNVLDVAQADLPKEYVDFHNDDMPEEIEDDTEKNVQEKNDEMNMAQAELSEENVNSDNDDMPEEIEDDIPITPEFEAALNEFISIEIEIPAPSDENDDEACEESDGSLENKTADEPNEQSEESNDSTDSDDLESEYPDEHSSQRKKSAVHVSMTIGDSSNSSTVRFLKRNTKRRPPRNLQPRMRKRQTNKELWVDVSAKKARDSGNTGIGRDGKVIEARKVLSGCNNKCKKKCQTRIDMEDRLHAHEAYWNLASASEKWQCLTEWTKSKNEPSYTDEDSDSEGTSTYQNRFEYYLPKKDSHEKKIVCQKMFLDTLDISRTVVRTAHKKKKESGGTGVVGNDQRGKHTNRPHKYPDCLVNLIIAHVNMYPTMESHYCRATTDRKYLEEGLNVSKMTRMLNLAIKKKHNIDNIISTQAYRRIFSSNFNYGFFKPKKDQCEFCEQYKNSNDQQKLELEVSYQQHMGNKKYMRKLVKNFVLTDTEYSKSIIMFHFDLQKILTTPKTEIGNLYYMSKFNIWNLTCYNVKSHDGSCFLWNETVGHRGSNEIASILMMYLMSLIESNPSVKEIHSLSDNCGGQNKNQNIFSMMLQVAVLCNVKIIHRFLEVGHTQSAGDSMHATIEKYCKHKQIFTQQQWGIHMTKCCKQPYQVKHIQQPELKDFSPLAENFSWKNVQISKVREITFDPADQKLVHVKYEFRENPKSAKIFKKNSDPQKLLTDFELQSAYETRIPLATKKKEDLQKMINKLWIPEKYHDYYNDIVNC